MKNEKYPKDGDEQSRKQLKRQKTEGNKYEEEQVDENKRMQKDEILDEEEDEEKEEEDEYVNHYQKRNGEDKNI